MDLQQLATMSAYIKQELAPLADKLGQGVEFTYGIFIKQVWVNVLSDSLWIFLGIPCLIFGLKWTPDAFKNVNDSPFFILTTLMIGFGLFMIFYPLPGLIQAFINPDYAAIKLIFETIKGVQQ